MDPMASRGPAAREKLEEYYARAGLAGSAHCLPEGSYAPYSSPRECERTLSDAANVVVAAAAGLVLKALPIGRGAGRAATDAVSIAVAHGRHCRRDSANELTDGICEALSIELARDPAWRVVAWPDILRYRREHQQERKGR
jgi:hypothetical protein